MTPVDRKLNSENEVSNLTHVLKVVIKDKGLAYKDLAAYLEVSISTVKRMLSKNDLSLKRLANICHWLEISLNDLFSLSKEIHNKDFIFSEKDEHFFAKNPSYLAFLRKIMNGKSPDEIAITHGLTCLSKQKYLLKLEELGLIRYNSKNEIVPTIKNSVQWDEDGELAKTFSNKMIIDFSNWAILQSPNSIYRDLQGMHLTFSQYKCFTKDLESIYKCYSQISNYNIKISKRKDVDYYSTMSIVAKWREEIYEEIENL